MKSNYQSKRIEYFFLFDGAKLSTFDVYCDKIYFKHKKKSFKKTFLKVFIQK